MKILYLITFLFLCFFSSCDSGSDNKKEKDTTAPDAVQLSVTQVENILGLSWTKSLASDRAKYIVEIISSDTIEIELDTVNTSYELVNLTTGTEYNAVVYVEDNSLNKSVASNSVSFTFTSYVADNESAWNSVSSGNFDEAIELFTSIINSSVSDKKLAYEGRGWAKIKKVNGDKTHSDIFGSISDLNKALSNDGMAGLSIITLLKDDYASCVFNADKIDALTSYSHKNSSLSHIDQTYVRIHGAFGYWFKKEDNKVNAYLDKIDPENAPFSLSHAEQLTKLQELAGTISAPIIQQKINSLK